MAGLDFEGRLDSVAVGPAGVVAGGMACAGKNSCYGTSAVLGPEGTWTVSPATGQEMGFLGRLAATGDAYFGLAQNGSALDLWRSEDGLAWQPVSGLPATPDGTAYRGVDLAAVSDRLVVAGWAAVAGGDSFRNISYSSPPWPPPTLGVPIPGTGGPVRRRRQPRPAPTSSPRHGLAVDGLRVLRTEDMGKTWTKARPPGWSATAAGLVAVVDAETMYAALPGPPATIAATHDGGASWAQATIDDPAIECRPADVIPEALTMAPPRSSPRTNGSSGSTRRRMAASRGPVRWSLPPRRPSRAARSKDHRVASCGSRNGKADNKPFDNTLFLSMDGGATWKDGPCRSETQRRGMTSSGRRRCGRMEAGRIVMAISLGEGPLIYESDDDGQTWRFVKGVRMPSGVDLLSATTWILVAQDGSEVWSTVDGGDQLAEGRRCDPALAAAFELQLARPRLGHPPVPQRERRVSGPRPRSLLRRDGPQAGLPDDDRRRADLDAARRVIRDSSRSAASRSTAARSSPARGRRAAE